MEFRRIFGRPGIWLFVILAICCNLLLFRQTQTKEYGTIAKMLDTTPRGLMKEYEEQLEMYRAMAPEEAYEVCQAGIEAERGVGAWNVETYVREYYVLPLLKHLKEYPEYLEQVQENAGRLQRFSIFTNEGAFSKRNILITAEDFAHLTGTEPKAGNYYGIKALIEYRIADYLIILLLLSVCWQMLAERKKGLWNIVRLTGGGRFKLACRRGMIFLFAALFFFLLLYGSTLLMDYICYGIPELSVPAQSMPELARLPVVMSLGGFLVQYLIVKVAGTMLLALILWIILSAVTNTTVAMAAAGLAMAVEYGLFAFLPAQSLFNLLKYCNLFSYFYLDQLYTHYLNMNCFGFPVNSRELLLGLLPGLLVLGFGSVIAINSCKRTEGRRGPLLWLYERGKKQTDRVVSRLHGFGYELYKTLVVQKGLFFLIFLVWLMCQLFPVWGGKVDIGRNMLEIRQEQWEGPADDPKIIRLMEEEKADLDQGYREYDQLCIAYEAGAVSGNEMMTASILISAVDARQTAYNKILEDIQEMEQQQETLGIRPWIMNDKWLESLLEEDQVQRELGLLALLMPILLLAPVYAYEKQTGAGSIIRGSQKGRGHFVLRKQMTVLVCVVLIWLMVYGMHFWSVIRFYGVHGLGAPIQAVQNLRNSDWILSVGQFLALVYGLRLAALWFAAQIILLISSYTRKVQSAVLVGIFIVLLPSALWVIGVTALEPVSIARPLSVIEVFRQSGFSGLSGFVPYVVLAGMGIGCCVWTGRKWMRT